jgi:PRTRC genetic system protein E
MAIFDTFAAMLKHDERIQFTVTKKGDLLTVLVQPSMGGTLDNFASDDLKKLHAALSMPLYITASPDELDHEFPRSLAAFTELREGSQNTFSAALDRVKEAGKQASLEAQPSPKTGAAKALAGDEGAAPSEATATVTEKSLF